MSLIERYILKTAFGAFLACLLGLTGIIWITQALRQIDLLTGKGQTFFVFLAVTALSLPTLLTVIAPVALFIAVVYALNKLNGDSELIVMSAAGMAPGRLIRPFAALALLVGLATAVMTVYVMPASFQNLRELLTKIRADFVANIVREGQFTTLDSGITFHYRERSGDALLGIFLQDRREAARTVVYLAERGRTAEGDDGQSYLVLEKGSVHRQQSAASDSSVVVFERYAVDLSAFNQDGGALTYKPRERTTWALLNPDPNESYYQWQAGRFRAELHDRLSAWIYPLAMAAVAFAALGDPRTTRQGRGVAVAAAVVGVVALRIAGFASSGATVRSAWGLVGVYGAPLAAIAASLALVFQGPAVKAAGARAIRSLTGAALPRWPSLRRA